MMLVGRRISAGGVLLMVTLAACGGAVSAPSHATSRLGAQGDGAATSGAPGGTPSTRRTSAGAVITVRTSAAAAPGATCSDAVCSSRPPGCPTVATATVAISYGGSTASDAVPVLAPSAVATLTLLGGGVMNARQGEVIFVVAQVTAPVTRVTAAFPDGASDDTVPAGGLAVLAAPVALAGTAPVVAIKATGGNGLVAEVTWGSAGTDWIGCGGGGPLTSVSGAAPAPASGPGTPGDEADALAS